MEKIEGVVIGRATILPSGKVEQVENVSGAPMLAKALRDQMVKWTLREETENDEPCQTLVIADFRLSSPYGKNLLDEPKAAPPGVIRLLVEGDGEPEMASARAENGAARDRAAAHEATLPDNLESSTRRP